MILKEKSIIFEVYVLSHIKTKDSSSTNDVYVYENRLERKQRKKFFYLAMNNDYWAHVRRSNYGVLRHVCVCVRDNDGLYFFG